MADGMVPLDSALGRELGFTSDLFDGYLWQHEREIWVSFIASHQPGQGHFRQLVDRILGMGYEVVVPTPLGRMVSILRHMGFIQGGTEVTMPDGSTDVCETWRRAAAEGTP